MESIDWKERVEQLIPLLDVEQTKMYLRFVSGAASPRSYFKALGGVRRNGLKLEPLLLAYAVYMADSRTDDERLELDGILNGDPLALVPRGYSQYGTLVDSVRSALSGRGLNAQFSYYGERRRFDMDIPQSWIRVEWPSAVQPSPVDGEKPVLVKVVSADSPYFESEFEEDLEEAELHLVVTSFHQRLMDILPQFQPFVTDVFEESASGLFGALIGLDMNSVVQMNYIEDAGHLDAVTVDRCYLRGGCRPKFYAMAWKKAEAVKEKMAGSSRSSLVGMRNIDGSVMKKDSAGQTGGYYCIDWSHPGNADRGTGGDTAMKSCLRRVYATLPAGRYVTADAPCLIVDTDRLSVMEFRLPKSADRAGHPVLPFLLDSHALAYRLSDVGADVDPDRAHKAYRDAATRLDGRFVQWVSDLENMMSDVVGCHYHMSMSEKVYILDKYGAEMLFDRKRLLRQEDKYAGVYLRPCGFDLVPYLEALDSRLLVKFVKTGEDRGYCRLTGADMSDAMLFGFIMNAMIAVEYSSLDKQEKRYWDGHPWGQPDIASSDNAPEWRKSRGEAKEFEYADTSRGESLKVWETRQMNAGYFASLFDVDANSLTKLKSTAIDKVKAGTGNRQLVIQAVNAVLRSRLDED